jgi:hypothetical protein
MKAYAIADKMIMDSIANTGRVTSALRLSEPVYRELYQERNLFMAAITIMYNGIPVVIAESDNSPESELDLIIAQQLDQRGNKPVHVTVSKDLYAALFSAKAFTYINIPDSGLTATYKGVVITT